ncbi:AMP-binding protein, partial [Pseudoalteromonas sp. MMG013]
TFDLATLFEQHAQATPNAIAIATADGETLSYQALNHRADTLAAYIVESHPDADTCLPADCPIALYFERSVNMLVAILATLKAGGAYVPVSPQYPHSRVEFILEDTQTALVLTDTTLCDTLAPMLDQAQCINVDLCTDPLVDITLTRPNNLERLAYIIYTSGTTGTPKGVMLSQRNALYYLDALTHALGKQYQRIDFSSNYCFDLSVTTTLCPLLHGQQICLYTGDILDVDAYRDHIRT